MELRVHRLVVHVQYALHGFEVPACSVLPEISVVPSLQVLLGPNSLILQLAIVPDREAHRVIPRQQDLTGR